MTTAIEVGTGTGFHASLPASRLSDDAVTTIEVDDDLVDVARENLARAGLHPGGMGGRRDRLAHRCPLRPPAVHLLRSNRAPAWLDQVLPDGRIVTPWDTAPPDGAAVRLWLADDAATSWAAIDVDGHQHDHFRLLQHGPCRLADEIEAAHAWWTADGQPAVDRFGVTATPAGQTVWLDDPRPADPPTPTPRRRGRKGSARRVKRSAQFGEVLCLSDARRSTTLVPALGAPGGLFTPGGE